MIDFNTKQVKVYINSDYIAINTYSGCRMFFMDRKGKEFMLKRDIPYQEIGGALIEALNESRLVMPEWWDGYDIHAFVFIEPDLFDFRMVAERYEHWVERFKNFTGVKTKNKLFKPMYFISVQVKDGILAFTPSHQCQMEAWEGVNIKEKKVVEIKLDSSKEEIGMTLLQTTFLCTSRFS